MIRGTSLRLAIVSTYSSQKAFRFQEPGPSYTMTECTVTSKGAWPTPRFKAVGSGVFFFASLYLAETHPVSARIDPIVAKPRKMVGQQRRMGMPKVASSGNADPTKTFLRGGQPWSL